jgi:aminoglycoside phosphotransferase (APT) family kinase protein
MPRCAPTLIVMVTDAPSEATLRAVVRGAGANAVSVTRNGEDVEVLLADGRELTLFFAEQAEVETWRRILAPAGIGPQVFGAGKGWVLVERVAGVALADAAMPLPWELAAGWLGRLHGHYGRNPDDLRAANPYLLQHGRSWFAAWCGRALVTLATSPDPRARRLLRSLEHYHRATRELATLPVSLVHGDLRPRNVLVDVARRRVWARDWGAAAVGPGLVDLAMLIEFADEAERARLLRIYARAAKARISSEDLDRCRLHLALQAIGRSPADRSSQVHDRIGEALTLAEGLAL